MISFIKIHQVALLKVMPEKSKCYYHASGIIIETINLDRILRPVALRFQAPIANCKCV